jgi:bifunctional enzyme CysN/CysC
MRHLLAENLVAADTVREFIADQEQKSLLRFLTCGSVDDGKSTLIGRLLSDTKQIFEDQLATLERDSKKHGTTGDDIDFALLVDGLEAEREQGITIDVAYRFFATPKRKFIVADTPGHEQYTRNMATGASTADLAIVLVDARQGVLRQTRRHSIIASLLGIRHVVLAVNKIDLVGFDRDVFAEIVADYTEFAKDLGFSSIVPIPMSARFGDNVSRRSTQTGWYAGPTLIDHLEMVAVGEASEQPFRFPVQYVNRPNLDFRGFAGTVASGGVTVGDEVVVAKSGRRTRVKRIVTYDGGTAIDGVPGTAAPVRLNFMDIVGSKTGKLLPTGNLVETIDGVEVTLIDVAMPMMIFRAADMDKTGYETPAELDADPAFFARIGAMRKMAGARMGLGDVTGKVIPKVAMLAAPRGKGHIAARYFVPHKTHAAFAVTGGLCVSSCAMLEGSVSDGLVKRPEGCDRQVVIEHPSGLLDVALKTRGQGADMEVISGGVIRTARKLMAGEVYVPSHLLD